MLRNNGARDFEPALFQTGIQRYGGIDHLGGGVAGHHAPLTIDVHFQADHCAFHIGLFLRKPNAERASDRLPTRHRIFRPPKVLSRARSEDEIRSLRRWHSAQKDRNSSVHWVARVPIPASGHKLALAPAQLPAARMYS